MSKETSLHIITQCLLWSTAITAKGSLLHTELFLLVYDGMFMFLIFVSLLIKILYSLILTWTTSRKLISFIEKNFHLRTWQALGITREKHKKTPPHSCSELFFQKASLSCDMHGKTTKPWKLRRSNAHSTVMEEKSRTHFTWTNSPLITKNALLDARRQYLSG